MVLLCDYTEHGAFGLIVNRQMDEFAHAVVKTDPKVRVDPELRLFVGGPVDAHSTWIVMAESQGPDEDQREVCPGVLLSVSRQLTLELLQSPPSSRARVVVGCAVWGPGQLDAEIAESSWLTTEVDPSLIFGVPPELMWETAIRRLGTDPAKLQVSSGSALMTREPPKPCEALRLRHMRHLTILVSSLALVVACSREAPQPTVQTNTRPTTDPETKKLETMVARFAPVDLTADISALPANERQALAKLVEAAKIFDALFLRQVWDGNETLLLDLARDSSPLGRARLHYFLINKGPWSRLDHNEPFIAGVPPKPAEANFYPAGATKDEVEAWLKGLSGASARGPRDSSPRSGAAPTARSSPCRTPSSTRVSSPASAKLLREAAALTTQPTLKSFLEKRAAALLSNDYYDSDVAWMELDASIEPTIGPYEIYEDEWFNYKAAFEAFITLRDDAETQKLARFGSELQEIENNLPIDPKFRNPKLGRAGADPRRQHRVLVGRRQSRRADRGLQPAQRRARHHREGLEARDAEEQPGGQVPDGAAADQHGGARRPTIGSTCRSTRSSRTS